MTNPRKWFREIQPEEASKLRVEIALAVATAKANKNRVKSTSRQNNRKVLVGDIKFDSMAEAARCVDLCTMLIEGTLSQLRIKPTFDLIPKTTYTPDYSYIVQGKLIAEDVKGFKTDSFRLKAKMFKYFHPDWELILT